MDGNAGVIFTNPYRDVDTDLRIVTVAAPVYDGDDTTQPLGVVGIDLDFSDIEQSINGLKVVDDEGYAFLLAPGGTGEVVVHKDLSTVEEDAVYITELESGVDREEFNLIVAMMDRDCSGNATYSKNEATWILAWKHETASSSGEADGSGVCGSGGYVTVVTVSKDALLEVSTTCGDYRTILVRGILVFEDQIDLSTDKSCSISKKAHGDAQGGGGEKRVRYAVSNFDISICRND